MASEIPPESLPLLFLACGSQDLFVRDNRALVQRLAERKLPYEYREISPFGHSWDVWDVRSSSSLGSCQNDGPAAGPILDQPRVEY